MLLYPAALLANDGSATAQRDIIESKSCRIEFKAALDEIAILRNGQIDIALVGDSYTQNSLRYSERLADYLYNYAGYAGAGWTGYGWYGGERGDWVEGEIQPRGLNGNVKGLNSISYNGQWVSSYNKGDSPDLSYVESHTPGSYLKRKINEEHNSSMQLYFIPTADGVIKYRTKNSNWKYKELYQSKLLADSFEIQLGPEDSYVYIEVVSGTVKLSGDNVKNSMPGVRVHKLGASGSTIVKWVNVDKLTQVESWGKMEIDFWIFMDGTNSQKANISGADWKSHLKEIISRFKEASPCSDILVVSPPENMREGNPIEMPTYSQAANEVAYSTNSLFLDLQPFFGAIPSEYSYQSNRPLFSEDLIHPTLEDGGRVMFEAIRDFIIK